MDSDWRRHVDANFVCGRKNSGKWLRNGAAFFTLRCSGGVGSLPLDRDEGFHQGGAGYWPPCARPSRLLAGARAGSPGCAEIYNLFAMQVIPMKPIRPQATLPVHRVPKQGRAGGRGVLLLLILSFSAGMLVQYWRTPGSPPQQVSGSPAAGRDLAAVAR